MSEVGWFYDNAGQQAGPLGQAALVELIRAGRIGPGARVWRPGLSGWVAWETVPELSDLVTAPPGGPPPLSTPPVGAPPAPQGWGPVPGTPGAGAPPFSGNSYAADVLTGAGAGALYPKAPLGNRFLAALVDQLISTVPAGLLVIATVSSFLADATVVGVVFALLALVAVAWALYYSFTKDGRPGGQSVGKKMTGLMVVHLPSNLACDRGQSALRYLVLFLLNLVPYVGWLIEPVVTLAAAGGRRLGDSAAGTQVIRATDYRPRH